MTDKSTPTGAADIYRETITKPISEIAAELQQLLGQRIVAYTVGVRSPKIIGRWAAGEHKPRMESDKRLRELYWTVLVLQQFEQPDTIRAFLMGSNPNLQYKAPIEIIREDRGIEAVHAAKAFINA